MKEFKTVNKNIADNIVKKAQLEDQRAEQIKDINLLTYEINFYDPEKSTDSLQDLKSTKNKIINNFNNIEKEIKQLEEDRGSLVNQVKELNTTPENNFPEAHNPAGAPVVQNTSLSKEETQTLLHQRQQNNKELAKISISMNKLYNESHKTQDSLAEARQLAQNYDEKTSPFSRAEISQQYSDAQEKYQKINQSVSRLTQRKFKIKDSERAIFKVLYGQE